MGTVLARQRQRAEALGDSSESRYRCGSLLRWIVDRPTKLLSGRSAKAAGKGWHVYAAQGLMDVQID